MSHAARPIETSNSIIAGNHLLKLTAADAIDMITRMSSIRNVVCDSGSSAFAVLSSDVFQLPLEYIIHKLQGSEYHTVIVVVPPVGSPLLRRELLDTAVTRAHKHLVLIASEDAITSAVMSTINRASGLAARIRGQRQPFEWSVSVHLLQGQNIQTNERRNLIGQNRGDEKQ